MSGDSSQDRKPGDAQRGTDPDIGSQKVVSTSKTTESGIYFFSNNEYDKLQQLLDQKDRSAVRQAFSAVTLDGTKISPSLQQSSQPEQSTTVQIPASADERKARRHTFPFLGQGQAVKLGQDIAIDIMSGNETKLQQNMRTAGQFPGQLNELRAALQTRMANAFADALYPPDGTAANTKRGTQILNNMGYAMKAGYLQRDDIENILDYTEGALNSSLKIRRQAQLREGAVTSDEESTEQAASRLSGFLHHLRNGGLL